MAGISESKLFFSEEEQTYFQALSFCNSKNSMLISPDIFEDTLRLVSGL